MRILEKLDLHVNSMFYVREDQLPILRWLFCLIAYLVYPFERFYEFYDIPNYLYAPKETNIAYLLFQEVPSEFILWLMDLSMIISFSCLLTGYKVIRSTWVYVISCTLYYAVAMSFQKIDHTYFNIIVFLPIAYLSSHRGKVNYGYIFIAFYLLTFCFFSAGLPKVLDESYLDVSVHHVSDIISRYNNDSGLWIKLVDFMPLSDTIMLESLDYVALAFELLIPLLALINLRWAYFFLINCSLFHLMNYYLLGIPFMGTQLGYVFFSIWGLLRIHPIKYDFSRYLGNKKLNLIALSVLVLSHWLKWDVSLGMKYFVSTNIIFLLIFSYLFVHELKSNNKIERN